MQRWLPWVLLGLLAHTAYGQWLNYPAPGTPRTRDGKPNLTARAPRASNGKPDLSGLWHVEPTPVAEMERLFGKDVGAVNVPGMGPGTISKYFLNIFLDFKPAEMPLRPGVKLQPFVGGLCQPAGIPISFLVSEPDKIVQTPGLIVILYETDDTHRQIYTDGRPLPKDPVPAWLGYSVGKWEGDTLVVETAGFNDRTVLDAMGHPHSDALRVIERYHRRDFGHMDVEMTFDDPKIYTRAFTIKITQELWPDSDILEFVCNENEKDRPHLETK
jgi:hypothetical protein